ncbi:MAG: 3,5-nucleoside bisphosphate phosphatase, partial [Thermomicrobiales bacterium]|nr:3,5-nucleoside bisphosphate phosphatase [Thermomicrobiales bacterium]
CCPLPSPLCRLVTTMGLVDLHTHSNVSDGLLTPTELIREARERGVRALALTDHETVAGLAEAESAARLSRIEFVPGVELNTDVDRHEVHILGYYVNRDDDEFVTGLAILEQQRVERIERMVGQLQEVGTPLDLDRVRELAGPGTIGRPHVARAMIERGYVTSVGEAFDRYLASGRPGFVPRRRNEPEAAVRMILANGAVPVLAHPLTTGNVEGILHRLVPAGLLGLEVYYGEYDETIQQELRATANRWGLIATGGSDYHGEGFKHGRNLGGPPVPMESVARLREAAANAQTANGQDAAPAHSA